MKTKLLLSGFFLFAGMISSIQGQIIHVPGDFSTIQQGIDAATDDDTVLVAEGTYMENISFKGKAITVASNFILDGDTNHISNTIINGSQPLNPDSASVVRFSYGEDTTSVLCGFTITGGTGTSIGVAIVGGGVFLQYSGGKLLNNHIEYNTASNSGWAMGGGICAGAPITPAPWVVLHGNRINHNQSISTNDDEGDGGGVAIFYNLIMTYNQISYNVAKGPVRADGGGARISGVFGPAIEVNIRNNIITHNQAVSNSALTDIVIGGGLDIFYDCSGIVSDNDISFNEIEVAPGHWCYGTGLMVEEITSDDFIFQNNIIRDNTFTGDHCLGGGMCLYDTRGKFSSNVIQNNFGTEGGGIGIAMNSSLMAILINNTITGNEGSKGGGLYGSNANAVIINTIIWGNTATSGASIYNESSTLEVRYSDVEGADVWPGEGNIIDEPQFLADGYHIDNSSMLVNEGISTISINGASYDCPGYDIDGETRPFANTPPEIGVDEVPVYIVGESILTKSLAINVYPDPADQIVTISIKNGAVIKEVSIYNQSGQNVYNGIPDNNTLDVSELQPGMYIIVVSCNQQRFRGKLIIE